MDQVFILRFWREKADAGEQGRWRVLVRNINTRRRDVVDGVAHAFAIVTANLNSQTHEHEAPPLPTDEPSGSFSQRRERERGRPND
jgi:hypothetical protein